MQINTQKINNNAAEVCRVLNNYGYKAYIVGGCVRDLFLGLEPKDWDIATNAAPDLVQKMFEKTYPTGLQHGTVTVSMNEEHFEVTTFRVEGAYLDGRHPSEVFFTSKIEDDLGRRDLTINAMAYDPISNELIDPYNGIKDLENGLIRCVGSAIDRLTEDGLRIMRVVRFASRFNYKIDDRTARAMHLAKETLEKVSKERITDELKKILMTENAKMGLTQLTDLGVLGMICPKLVNNSVWPQRYYLYQDYNGELETRVASMYAQLSIENVKEELTNLKFSNKEIKKITFLLLAQVELFKLFPAIGKDIYSWQFYTPLIAFIKNNAPDTYDHSVKEFSIFSFRPELLMYFKGNNVFAKNEMLLNGNDLLSLGFPPGPSIKNCLNAAYNAILENPENNNMSWLTEFAQNQLKA